MFRIPAYINYLLIKIPIISYKKHNITVYLYLCRIKILLLLGTAVALINILNYINSCSIVLINEYLKLIIIITLIQKNKHS